MNLREAVAEFKTAILAGAVPPSEVLQTLNRHREVMPEDVRAAVHQMTCKSFPKSPAPFQYSQGVYRLRVYRMELIINAAKKGA